MGVLHSKAYHVDMESQRLKGFYLHPKLQLITAEVGCGMSFQGHIGAFRSDFECPMVMFRRPLVIDRGVYNSIRKDGITLDGPKVKPDFIVRQLIEHIESCHNKETKLMDAAES